MPRKFRNEGESTPPEEITVEDVMDKLEEILSEVKKQMIKIRMNQKQTESKHAENSFARLFNMNIK